MSRAALPWPDRMVMGSWTGSGSRRMRIRLDRMGFAVALISLTLGSTGCANGGGGSESIDTDLRDSANWHMFGHDYHNTRSNTVETTIGVDNVDQLELLWEHVGVQVTSTPAVVDGVVYYADWSGKFYAKNASDGSKVWTSQVSDRNISASPAITRDEIYVGAGGAVLYCLDRATGDVRWSVDLDDHPNAGMQSSPIPVGDRVLIGISSGELGSEKEDYTFRGSIVAIDRSNGDELWRVYVAEDDETSGAGVSVWSSAAVDTEREMMFIGTGQAYEAPAGPRSDAVMAIDYMTGDVKWVAQFTADDVYRLLMPLPQGPDADIGAAPNLFRVGDTDVVGVGDKGGVYAALDRDTGEVVWTHVLGPGSHLGGVMAPAAYHADRLYVTQNSWPAGFDTGAVFVPDFDDPENTSDVVAMNAQTGEEIWRMSTESPSIGGLLYANGVVYSAHTLGLLRAYDADTGEELWARQIGTSLASGQTISDGRLFVTHGFSFIGITGNAPGMEGGIQAYGLP